ncbi:unnamed protein product, partial [Rotaria sp. Silwood2]
MKKHYNDEHELLIASETKSYDNRRHNQRQSSRLEWAESSWTRCLHILCWWWVNPILSLGYKRVLTDNDLDDLPYADKSSTLLRRIEFYDWTAVTAWKIVVQMFWKEYMAIGLFNFPFLIAHIAQPLLIRLIVINLSNKQQSPTAAYLYAIFFSICALVQVVFQQPLHFYSSRVGVKIRNALMLMIYKHSLSLKLVSFEQINTAQIVNLIANDITKLQDACRYLHHIWGALLELLIVFGLLCWIIGPLPILFSYIIFVLFIFIQLIFNQKFAKYRKITASCSDKRVHALSEFIHGYYIIKMYNWEKSIEDRIHQMRQHELTSIRQASRLRALNKTQFFISTQLLALTTFGSMWLLKYSLNPIDIFTTLSFFNLMRHSVTCLIPIAIERLSETHVALKKIDTFMRLTTVQQEHSLSFTSSLNQGRKGSIAMSDATFSWNNENLCLFSLNITVEPATFVGITGPVGSGKSSLFGAILGELNLVNGQLNTYNSSFSYTPQSPWIFADTLRNNILLERSFDEQRYKNVIYACCLDVDIDLFGPSRDLIMIGENGVNLSGGQKARVSLARALYNDADIYLLDDPLSEVDNTVAKQIYERCIGSHGLLKHKTRLLITHQTQFLIEVHQIIFFRNGHIDKESYFDENIIKNDETTPKENPALTSMLDLDSSIDDRQPIITEEVSVSGTVSWSIWLRLFTASSLGLFGLCLLIILLLTGEFLYDVSNYWLKLWSTQSYRNQQERPIFFYIYFGLILALLFVDLLRSNYFFSLMLDGSNRLHNNMLKRLLSTSIQFFERNPSGRILNRATKDQQVLDELVPTILLDSIEWLLIVAGSMIMICLINPYVLLSFIVILPIFWILSHFYLQSNREIKRLENVTRSPVYTLFSTSLRGLSTIRAFKAKEHFMELLTDRIDRNTRANITMLGAMQWISLRFNLISCLVMFITAILVIVLRNKIQISSIALSLMCTISIIVWFSWGLRQLMEATILMTSAERIDEYARLPHEDDQDTQKRLITIPPEWPSRGTIEFRNYFLRYRSDAAPVLKNLTIRIESGEKIGIIGRTGAGKSSLFNGLFRFIDRSNADGEILIDDIDISRIPLNYLRSRLCVIPQQLILFSDTLRYNLDPFNQYSDEQCWMALEDVQLKNFVSKNPAGLLMPIAESGNNLSTGQCQLICIARGILKKSKFLLIDEATANIDSETDELIQEIIAKKFEDRTVLTIAHRLNTVTKSDRILVLAEGVIINFDIP